MSYNNPRQDRGGTLTGIHDSDTCPCGQCQWVELRAKLTDTMQRQAPFVNRLTTLEADNLFAIPATFPPDITTLGAKADWLATVHLERFGEEEDSWEFERLCRGYGEKLARVARRPSTMTVHDLALVRTVLMDVIDEGAPWQSQTAGGNLGRPWTFYPTNGYWKTETEATNADRLDFCDEVQRRIVERVGRERG